MTEKSLNLYLEMSAVNGIVVQIISLSSAAEFKIWAVHSAQCSHHNLDNHLDIMTEAEASASPDYPIPSALLFPISKSTFWSVYLLISTTGSRITWPGCEIFGFWFFKKNPYKLFKPLIFCCPSLCTVRLILSAKIQLNTPLPSQSMGVLVTFSSSEKQSVLESVAEDLSSCAQYYFKDRFWINRMQLQSLFETIMPLLSQILELMWISSSSKCEI